MDVIYVGQLSPAWGIRDHALSQSPQVSRGVTPILICPDLVQKKVPNKKTLLYPELTKNPIPKKGSVHYIYAHFYIDFTL